MRRIIRGQQMLVQFVCPTKILPSRHRCITLMRRIHNIWILPILVYEGYPESIRPFWISREPVAWPWSNLAASQRRPYCASVNSHCPVGLVSRQWDAVDWACVLCDRRIYSDGSEQIRQCACPFCSSRAGFFLAKHDITQVSQPPYSPN